MTDSTRLNFDLQGEGPILVLLHEIGGSLHSWSPVVPALAKHFRVLSYDQRGTGKSPVIRGAFTLDTHISDLAALLRSLDLPPYHIAGVAIGCALAARFAAAHPRDVASLVLACPAMSVSEDRKVYLAGRAAVVEREGMSAAIDSTLANSYPSAVQRDRAAYEAYRERFLQNDPASYAAINRAFAQFDATPDLAVIRCPTLVLAGTHDRLRPPPHAREVADRIANARFEEIDSGHIMPVQAPAEMARAMLGFYAAIGKAAKSP